MINGSFGIVPKERTNERTNERKKERKKERIKERKKRKERKTEFFDVLDGNGKSEYATRLLYNGCW